MASGTSDLIVRLSLDTTQFEGSLSKFEGQMTKLQAILHQRQHRDHQLQAGDGAAADLGHAPDGQAGRAEAEGSRSRSRL